MGSRRTPDLCIEIAPCQMRNRFVAAVKEYKLAFPYQFVAREGETREGEAPAEPPRRQTFNSQP